MEKYYHRRLKVPQSLPLSPNMPKSSNSSASEQAKNHGDNVFIFSFFTALFGFILLTLISYVVCRRRFSINDDNTGSNTTSNNANRRGVNPSLVEQFPTVLYDEYVRKEDGLMCSICVMEFEDTEVLRLLPKCEHSFHNECIEEWLKIRKSCPICRSLVEATDVDLIPYINTTRLATQQPAGQEQVASGRDEFPLGRSHSFLNFYCGFTAIPRRHSW